MKKKLLLRGLFGFPVGIAISYVITIIVSAIVGKGIYLAVTPQLVSALGNELNAVILQAVLSGLLGAGFAMASVIWELDHWSIAKQSGVYFVVIAVILLPISYVTHWMEHSVAGFLTYFAIFISIFLITWMIQYFIWKNNVKKINESVKNISSTK